MDPGRSNINESLSNIKSKNSIKEEVTKSSNKINKINSVGLQKNKIFNAAYLKVFRKIVYFFYIFLNAVYHGFEVEFYRLILDWNTMRTMEIVLLFLIIVDTLLLEFVFLRFKNKVPSLLILLCCLLAMAQVGLKIYGPENENLQAGIIKENQVVNIFRISISLLLIYGLDEHKLLKKPSNKKLNKEDLLNPLDKNQNPEFSVKRGSIKVTNSLIIKPHSKTSNKLLKNSMDITDIKLVDQITSVIKQKFKRGDLVSERSNAKLNLNSAPFERNLMKNLDSLLLDSFDIFRLNNDCFENPIFLLMNYYYHFYNFESLNIPESKYMNLIFNIENNYNHNPYHNAIHAADVVNTTFYILEVLEFKTASAYTDLETMLILLSGAMHDVDHPGNTNAYEINSRSLLSLTYNDKSVLENYHLFLFFNFLINDNMNIFMHFDLEGNKRIRKTFISNIIATDMANHMHDIKKMKDMLNNPNFDPKEQQSKDFLMTQVIHFSDISNGAKPFNIYKKWVDRLFVEFYAQGDKEREMGVPISMLCDREKTVIPDAQVFFISFFTMDLVSTFNIGFPKFQKLLAVCETNKKLWEELKGKPYVISSD